MIHVDGGVGAGVIKRRLPDSRVMKNVEAPIYQDGGWKLSVVCR